MDTTPLAPMALRSLFSAWSNRHEGPKWAPWAWTAALNALIAVLITVLIPASGGFALNLLVSEAIGLTIHALFVVLGRAFALNQFAMPVGLRLVYMLAVVMAGSWFGYIASFWIVLRDFDALMRHMSYASRYLMVIPAVWAVIVTVAIAGIHRLQARQLALERERGDAIRAQREAIAARLALLSAQVEPHFLYNTLGSAKYLVRSDPARAEEIIDNLILYLRHSLPRVEDAESTLGAELERARAYLDIMRIRMGDRLRTHMNVPENLLATPFPTMMLQTLVENAIKHGLEPKTGGGTIWVLGVDKGDRVAITVADDGIGLQAKTSGSGVGLRNVRERLHLAYGGAASLDLAANFPAGAAATITLPKARDDKGAP